MQLERNGKLITNIEKKKSSINVYMSDERLEISSFAMLETNLYVGKTLYEEDINELIKLTNVSKNLDYAYSLLKKKRYSEKRLVEKLVNKNATNEEIEFIINKLKTSGLINDEELLKDLIEISNSKLFGRLRILDEIKKQGLSLVEADKLLPYEKEDEKFAQFIEETNKKLINLPKLKKIEKIKQKAINYGYNQEQIDSIDYNSLLDDEDNEIISLEKELKTAVLRLEDKYDGKLLKDKVFKSLMGKGYSYNSIDILWEEYINEINK